MSGLLAIYDPSGKLGLTDPSPGGGSVPTVYVESHEIVCLLLVTGDGTPDPIGMARAREVLARVLELGDDCGALFHPDFGRWRLETADGLLYFSADANEAAPEALARLLSEHAGVEVIRG